MSGYDERWNRERAQRFRTAANALDDEEIREAAIAMLIDGAVRVENGREVLRPQRELCSVIHGLVEPSPYGPRYSKERNSSEMAAQDIHAPFNGRHNHNHHDHSHPHSHDHDNDHSHDRDASSNHQHEEESAERGQPITINEAGPRRMRGPVQTRADQEAIRNYSDRAKGMR